MIALALADTSVWLIFGLSLVVCGAIILLASSMRRLAGREADLTSVQAAHRVVTPRVGGIAIFAALIATTSFAPIAIETAYAQFVLAAGILFATGLAEDLGWHVPPKGRLFAATVACVLVIVLLDAWVPRIGWSLLDPIMANGLLGIPLTIFVVVGISNAFNLIDGVNGLAGGAAFVCAIGLARISDASGYDAMMVFTVLLALGIAGFLLLNYPFGWIFSRGCRRLYHRLRVGVVWRLDRDQPPRRYTLGDPADDVLAHRRHAPRDLSARARQETCHAARPLACASTRHALPRDRLAWSRQATNLEPADDARVAALHRGARMAWCHALEPARACLRSVRRNSRPVLRQLLRGDQHGSDGASRPPTLEAIATSLEAPGRVSGTGLPGGVRAGRVRTPPASVAPIDE